MASDYDALQAALSAVTAERDRLRSKWARVESERDQLRAKVEMLREDAERYRWLVASGVNVTSVGGEPVRLTDQLVDAAMAAKEA